MSNLLEVLVTCDSTNPLWTCCVWDPHTGTSLMSYKGGGTAEPKTLSLLGKDYIAVVESTKPILHVWPLNSHQTVQGMRFILPGKASSFAVTTDGAFCIAGIDEKIYVWQISSGDLLTIISHHYQKVTILKFTPDGRYFISAAEDGMVMVWSLAEVVTCHDLGLVTQTSAGKDDPMYIFSDHSLTVTDLYVSKTGVLGRLCTVSIDRTCKIYDLTSGEMLLNLIFDIALSSITMDVLELNVFIGTTEGTIYQFGLTNPPRNRDVSVLTSENMCHTFSSHLKPVTCLSVSLDGETIMSGSSDEQVILWHIRSRQPIRTIRHKGPVTNAFFTTNLPAIYKQDFQPNIILHSLGRSLERNPEEQDIEILVENKNNVFWPITQEKDISNLIRNIDEIDKSREAELKTELCKLQNINASLYAFSIEKALASIPDKNTQNIKEKKFRKRKLNGR